MKKTSNSRKMDKILEYQVTEKETGFHSDWTCSMSKIQINTK